MPGSARMPLGTHRETVPAGRADDSGGFAWRARSPVHDEVLSQMGSSLQEDLRPPTAGGAGGADSPRSCEMQETRRIAGQQDLVEGRIRALHSDVRTLEQRLTASKAAAGTGAADDDSPAPTATPPLTNLPAPSCRGRFDVDRADDVAMLLQSLQEQLARTCAAVEAATRPDALYKVLAGSSEMAELVPAVQEVWRQSTQLAATDARLEALARRSEAELQEVATRCVSLADALSAERMARVAAHGKLEEAVAHEVTDISREMEARCAVLAARLEDLIRSNDNRSPACPSEVQPDGASIVVSAADEACITGAGGCSNDELAHVSSALNEEKAQRSLEGAALRHSSEQFAEELRDLKHIVRELQPENLPQHLAAHLQAQRGTLLAELDTRFAALRLEVANAAAQATAAEVAAASKPQDGPGGTVKPSSPERGRSPVRSDLDAAGNRVPVVRCVCRLEMARFTSTLVGGIQDLDRRLGVESKSRRAAIAAVEAHLQALGADKGEGGSANDPASPGRSRVGRRPPSERMDSGARGRR